MSYWIVGKKIIMDSFKKTIKAKFLEKLKPLKELNLPSHHYLIWGSGPLAIRGLRMARDIDLIVTKSLWNELTKKYVPEGPKENKIKIRYIEIWKDLLNLTDRIDDIIADRDMLDGFPFMKLSYTLEWKKYWNSKKDPADIVLIEKYLKSLCDCSS